MNKRKRLLLLVFTILFALSLAATVRLATFEEAHWITQHRQCHEGFIPEGIYPEDIADGEGGYSYGCTDLGLPESNLVVKIFTNQHRQTGPNRLLERPRPDCTPPEFVGLMSTEQKNSLIESLVADRQLHECVLYAENLDPDVYCKLRWYKPPEECGAHPMSISDR